MKCNNNINNNYYYIVIVGISYTVKKKVKIRLLCKNIYIYFRHKPF